MSDHTTLPIERLYGTAHHVATICAQKNAAYGDSVAASAEALRLLYPHGLRPDQYLDAIFAARDFDKRSRLAQLTAEMAERTDEFLREDLIAMREDALLDICGYALLRLHQHHTNGKEPAPCLIESASAPAAESPSRERNDFTAPSASGSTTATASARTDDSSSRPWQWESRTASASEAASAPTATEAASPNGSASPAPLPSVYNPADDPRANTILIQSALGRNRAHRCAHCNGALDPKHRFHLFFFGVQLDFDNRYCLTLFERSAA